MDFDYERAVNSANQWLCQQIATAISWQTVMNFYDNDRGKEGSLSNYVQKSAYSPEL